MKLVQYIWVSIIIFSLPGCGTTQDVKSPGGNVKYDVHEKIVDIHIDNLQNIYILNKENKVIKYNDDFVKQYEYSNNLIGEIKSIDATNPQKILCFIKDFNRILVLDNTLAEINTIDFSTSEYLDISAVARSNDDRIWLFDPINQVLVKVNDLIEKQYESNRLTDLNLGIVEPVQIIEKGNIVAVSDPEIGILIFDNFGQFLKLVPEKGIYDFQIFDKYLFFTQNKKYFQYHIHRFEKSEFPNMQEGFLHFIVRQNITYLIDENGVVVKKNK